MLKPTRSAQATYSLRMIASLCRPRNAIPPLLAMILGHVVGGGGKYGIAGFAMAWFGVLWLNFAATLQNDIADRTIDVDARQTPYTRGDVTTQQLRTATIGLAAIAIGPPLLLGQKQVVLFLLAYAVLVWAYNMPPLQLSRRPVSSIVLLSLLFQTLPFLFGAYIAAGNPNPYAIGLLAAGGFLQRFALSILKDYKDFDADKKHRKITFLVRFGPRAVRVTSLVFAIIGYGAIAAGVARVTRSPLAIVLTLPIAIYGVYLRWQLKNPHSEFTINNKLFHRVIDINNIYDAGVILCCYYFFL